MFFGLWLFLGVSVAWWLLATGPAEFSPGPVDDWPPIDDDEFMRRLPPGTDRDVALRTRKIISEQLGIEYHRIHPEQSFAKDLGCE